MAIDSAVTRRTLIIAGAATAGAAALAACSGGSDGANGSATNDSPTSEAATPESSAAPSSAASSSAAGSSAAPAADSIASLSELTVGEPKTVDLPDGKKGLLTRTSQSAVVCFSTVCTHEGCTVKPDGKELACPCHGSVFTAATGEPTSGPASSALEKIDVKVVGGQVVAG